MRFATVLRRIVTNSPPEKPFWSPLEKSNIAPPLETTSDAHFDNQMCNIQQHIGMLEQLHNNLVMSLRLAASEAFSSRTPSNHHILG